jgi:hypothetical protein
MRKPILSSAAAIALLLPCVTLAQPAPAAAGHAPLTATNAPATAPNTGAAPQLAVLLENKVRGAWEAFKRRDRDGYAKFLTDDFQAVESDGDGERSRQHVLLEVEHCQYTNYLLQLFQVQPIGPDHAFVTYESTMQFPRTAALRFRRVFVGELWARSNGQWKMMRYQETLVR